MDYNDKRIGRNIQAIRKANKKDVYEFATSINLSEDMLKKIECGDRHATDQTIQKVSDISGFSFNSIKYKDLSYLEKGDLYFEEDLTFGDFTEMEEYKEFSIMLLKFYFPIVEDEAAFEDTEFGAGVRIAHEKIQSLSFSSE